MRGLSQEKEGFLLMEVRLDGVDALFLTIDAERKLVIEKIVHGVDLRRFIASPLRRLSHQTWEGKYFFRSRRKVVVSADPSLATTMPIPLVLHRERSLLKDPITLPELENLIAQAMAKIFTQCRSEAAKRLAVDDIDAVLVGAKADRFRIDGRAVMNPVDFPAREISLLLELTFTTRALFEDLKHFFNSPDEFFFLETPQTFLRSLSRLHPLPLNLIRYEGGASTLFIFQKAGANQQPVLYREPFLWSPERLFEVLVSGLGVTLETARSIYGMYRGGRLSMSAERGLRKILQPVINELLRAVGEAKMSGIVYWDMPFLSPFDLPYRYKAVTFEEVSAREIIDNFGLEYDVQNAKRNGGILFRQVAPFLEAYLTKETSDINQKLRRRLHWLA